MPHGTNVRDRDCAPALACLMSSLRPDVLPRASLCVPPPHCVQTVITFVVAEALRKAAGLGSL